MKDKAMIEEMALQFAKKYCKACGCENCDWAYEFGTKEESCEDYLHYKQMAEHFYNLGYRKLLKDSVVLSKEKYENLGLVVETIQEYETVNGQPKLVNEKKIVKKLKTDFTDLLNQEIRELQIAQASKETAEKFFKELKTRLKDCPEVIEEGYNVQNSVDYFEDIIGYDKFCVDEIIKELAKQFGVEIKE